MPYIPGDKECGGKAIKIEFHVVCGRGIGCLAWVVGNLQMTLWN